MSVRASLGVGDVASGAAILLSWATLLTGTITPIVALLASILAAVFYIIQISESAFVKNWAERRRQARIARLTVEIASLQATVKVTETAREVMKQQ